MTPLNLNNSYPDWLKEVKERIKIARIKVALAANHELIAFYWDLGKMIAETQTAYGTGFIEQLSKDLSAEFPDMEGFSKTNLYNIRRFYQFYETDVIFHQLGGKLPWRHHVEILAKAKTVIEAHFYIQETIENGWSRDDIEVRLDEDTVWLTQAQIAILFGQSKQNISLHINNCFKEKELESDQLSRNP